VTCENARMVNLDTCHPERTRHLRPPGTLCDFYLRTPAGDDPAGPFHYRHIWPESYGGDGTLDLPSPPAVGDTIWLSETRPAGARGLFVVVGRDWRAPHYGSPAWPYGTPRPERGARLQLMVEQAPPGPFVNEAPDPRTDDQQIDDDERERMTAAARAELLAESMYYAYQRIVDDGAPRCWRDLTESPEIADAHKRQAWREAAGAAYTAITSSRLDPGLWGATCVDHDVIDDDGVFVGIDRTIMDTAAAARAAGLHPHAELLETLAGHIRQTWRGGQHAGDGLIGAAMHLTDYLISLANVLRDLQRLVIPGAAAALGVTVTPPEDPRGAITPNHGQPT